MLLWETELAAFVADCLTRSRKSILQIVPRLRHLLKSADGDFSSRSPRPMVRLLCACREFRWNRTAGSVRSWRHLGSEFQGVQFRDWSIGLPCRCSEMGGTKVAICTCNDSLNDTQPPFQTRYIIMNEDQLSYRLGGRSTEVARKTLLIKMTLAKRCEILLLKAMDIVVINHRSTGGHTAQRHWANGRNACLNVFQSYMRMRKGRRLKSKRKVRRCEGF